jgi:hypothetical protein
MHTFELQRPSRQETSKQQDGSELQLLTEHSDLYSQQTPAPIPQQVRTWLLALSGLLLLPVALSIAALALSATQLRHASSSSSNGSSPPGDSGTVRVAFGSCTAYDLRPQPIWIEVRPLGDRGQSPATAHTPQSKPRCQCKCFTTQWHARQGMQLQALTVNRSTTATACVQGVIPSSPHAWLWLGDIAYMDDPLVDCHSTGEGLVDPGEEGVRRRGCQLEVGRQPSKGKRG